MFFNYTGMSLDQIIEEQNDKIAQLKQKNSILQEENKSKL